jgi:hypothetical protein
MPKPSRNGHAALEPAATPILPVLDIRPDAVYTPRQVIAALGLRASSLRTEWRAGRLRIVRRCGHNYLLGKDIIAWLDGGELRRQRANNDESRVTSSSASVM